MDLTESVLFVLSVLHVGWRIVFLMSPMSNINGTKQHAQLSYHASGRAIANDCKKEILFEKQLALAGLLGCLPACTLAWQASGKNVAQVK